MEDVLAALNSASALLTKQNVLLQAALKPDASTVPHAEEDISSASTMVQSTENCNRETIPDRQSPLNRDDVDFINSVIKSAAQKPLSRSDARFLRIVHRLAAVASNPVIVQNTEPTPFMFTSPPKPSSDNPSRPASAQPVTAANVVDSIARVSNPLSGPTATELQSLQAHVQGTSIAREGHRIATLLKEDKTTEVILRLAAELASVRPNGNELMRIIVAQCRLLLNSDRVTLFIVEGSELVSRLIGSDGGGDVQEIRVPKGRGIVGYVAETGVKLNLHDAYSDFRFNADVDLKTGYRTKSLLTMPVWAGGEVVAVAQCINKLNTPVADVCEDASPRGVLSIAPPTTPAITDVIDFTKDDEALFELFAFFAGVAIRNQQLFKRAQRHHTKLELMVRAAEALASSLTEYDQLIAAVMKAAQHLVRADRCSLFVRDGDSLVARTDSGEIRVAVGQGIVGTCALTRMPLNITDAYSDPRFNREVDRLTGYKTVSLLAMPIVQGDKLVAVAQLLNRRREDLLEDEEDEIPLPHEILRGRSNSIMGQQRDDALDSSISGSMTARLGTAGSVTRGGTGGTARQSHASDSLTGTRPSHSRGHEGGVASVRAVRTAAAVVTSADFGPFRDDDIVAFAAFSAFIGAILRAAQQHSQLERDAEERATLAAAMNDVVTTDLRDIHKVVEGVMVGAMRVVRAERCAFFLRDKATNELYSRVASDTGREIRFPATHGVAGATATGGVPIIVPDAYTDPRFNPEVDRTSGFLTRNILCVPVKYEGEVIGVAQLLNKLDPLGRPCPFTNHDCDSLQIFASVAGVIIRNSALYEFLLESGQQANAVFEGVLGAAHGQKLRRRRSTFRDAQIYLPSSAKIGQAKDLMLRMPDHEYDALRAWGFDVFQYHWAVSDGEERLPAMVHWMYRDMGLLDKFELDQRDKLLTFVVAAQRKYRRVPYHSFTHAFDVTHAIYQMLTRGNLRRYFDDVWQHTLLLTAVMHDVDHTGVNNSYHHKAETPLGILSYVSGAQSVLEVHHCNLTIELLGYSEADLLSTLDEGMRGVVWKRIISLILNTDMARHKDNLEELTAWLEDLNGPIGDRELTESEQLRLAVAMIKSADISNVTKPFSVSRKWAEAVTEEFYQQGDLERDKGLSVIPMNDRMAATSLAEGQLGFITFVARKWFETFCKLSPDLSFMIQTMDDNVAVRHRVLNRWKQVQADYIAQQAKEKTPAEA